MFEGQRRRTRTAAAMTGFTRREASRMTVIRGFVITIAAGLVGGLLGTAIGLPSADSRPITIASCSESRDRLNSTRSRRESASAALRALPPACWSDSSSCWPSRGMSRAQSARGRGTAAREKNSDEFCYVILGERKLGGAQKNNRSRGHQRGAGYRMGHCRCRSPAPCLRHRPSQSAELADSTVAQWRESGVPQFERSGHDRRDRPRCQRPRAREVRQRRPGCKLVGGRSEAGHHFRWRAANRWQAFLWVLTERCARLRPHCCDTFRESTPTACLESGRTAIDLIVAGPLE